MPAEEWSSLTIADGYSMVDLAQQNLQLNDKVERLEALAVGLYNAAMRDMELLPVLKEYVQPGHKATQETNNQESPS